MSRRKGDSNTVLIVLLCIAVVAILGCCGGGYYLFSSFQKKMQQIADDMKITDPVRIESIRNEIATIDIPPAFKPVDAAIVPIVDVKIVMYRAEGAKTASGGFLSLASSNDANHFRSGGGHPTKDVELEFAGPEDVVAVEVDDEPADHDHKPHSRTTTADKAKGKEADAHSDGDHNVDKKADSKETEAKKNDTAEADHAEHADDDHKPGRTTASKKSSKAGKGTRPGKSNANDRTKSETREPMINGGRARFQIVQVFDADKKLEKIEVYGEFRTKSVTHAQLKMQSTADLVTLDQVNKMIDSIK